MAKPREVKMEMSPIRLELMSPCGPVLSNHAGCLIRNTLYVHGGINKYLSKEPLNTFYKLDLNSPSPIWTEILDRNSPHLSHHACLVLDNRYILFIGGWNGRHRTADMWAYDVQEATWIGLATSGFPEGAGLSSHAVVLLADGNILVVGREGSARIQRRYGNSWIIRGNVMNGHFAYNEHNLSLASRSGHTMHVTGSQLTIIGGRCDRPVEQHSGYRALTSSSSSSSSLSSTSSLSSSSSSSAAFFGQLNEFVRRASPLAKPPCGRKQHVSVSGSGLVLIHGGETFDGRSRHPVGDFYLLSLRPNVKWYHLGSSGVGRAGHVCCVSDDKIVIHGGLGPRNAVYGDSYVIKLSN
ncbi:hypothetical protein LSH36_775g00031 [Paralvinella palmiformis]|uniref:Uncharacterized protein n=1 Tax=Paralvinella palmiformis TaxID=53620 RepID=A0AAD9MV86_9ANNE|nr:hypothetical protein LSH36_775g00031 [Paralvinella palmiformis]